MTVAAGAAQPAGQGDFQMAWVSAEDGAITPIMRFEWWRSGGANGLGVISLSPDGRYIAYAAAPAQGSTERTVYVIGSDGKTRNEVASGGINYSPVWTPDGQQLVFVSDRAGGFGLSAVAVRNGRATTPVSVVRANTGRVRLHGFSGRLLYYSAHVMFGEVFVRPIERDGRLASASATIQNVPGIVPAWSPDGKFLALKRPRADGSFEVVLRNGETGQEQRWSGLRGDGQPLGSAQPVWLSSDRVRVGVRTLLEIADGELRTTAGDGAGVPAGSLSRDGSVVYVPRAASPVDGPGGIAILDRATRQQKSFFAVPNGVEAFALSPAGDVLAVTSPGRLSIIRVDGTQYRELYAAAGISIAASRLDWSPDGRFVIFAVEEPNGSGRLMRVSVSGGAPEPAGSDLEAVSVFDVSPDGTRIAYGKQKSVLEIWSLRVGQLTGK
jgi:Tol biopolymer transport system component